MRPKTKRRRRNNERGKMRPGAVAGTLVVDYSQFILGPFVGELGYVRRKEESSCQTAEFNSSSNAGSKEQHLILFITVSPTVSQ